MVVSGTKEKTGFPISLSAGVYYLVRERQGHSDDEEEERHDEVGHCYAVPRRVVQRRNECSGVIHDDHQLQQEKKLLVHICLNLFIFKSSALFFNENDREPVQHHSLLTSTGA